MELKAAYVIHFNDLMKIWKLFSNIICCIILENSLCKKLFSRATQLKAEASHATRT